MQIVNASEIIVGDNRQRRTFSPEGIADLSRSIQSIGLLHPIVCRKTDEGIYLVAGERRLRAMKTLLELDLPIVFGGTAYLGGAVPVAMMSELSADQAYEAELEENIIRIDLTWQERSQAIARLHQLRTKQAQVSGTPHSLRETVSEVKGAPANNNDYTVAREDIILAKHLADPDVAKAPSRKEALKVVEKKAKVAHRAKLAETFDLSKSPHTLMFGDCFQWLASLEEASIDCLLTDPPYGMDASDFGSNFATSHEYVDSWETFTYLASQLAEQAWRLLKDGTHAYVFCTYKGYKVLEQAFLKKGFSIWPHPMIWSKGNGNAPWIAQGHKKTYECILFASKGMREMTTVKPDVLSYPSVSDRDHAAEKPVELYADLLARSINPGEIVLDPFAGSGTIFTAADLCSCKAIGIELSEEYYNLALTKLKGD